VVSGRGPAPVQEGRHARQQPQHRNQQPLHGHAVHQVRNNRRQRKLPIDHYATRYYAFLCSLSVMVPLDKIYGTDTFFIQLYFFGFIY
jgi:hypothetical protein